MQTPLYTEDWIGLKTLDNAGKVHFISVAGGHLEMSAEDMKKHVVPYLKNSYSINNRKMMSRLERRESSKPVFEVSDDKYTSEP